MPFPLSDLWFLLAASTAVILLGLSKGGFAGVGAVATPLVALVVGPVAAAAIILPVLVAQDAVGVWAFRHSWDRGVVAVMLPGAVMGVAAASWFAAGVPMAAMEVALGAISILFAARNMWLARGGRVPAPTQPRRWFGVAAGIASGVTSQIAHAGQPPFQIYVLPLRLPRDVLIGTTAVFFAALNLIKLPAYLALGQFTHANLIASAALMPLAVLATFAGVWLVRRVEAARFYTAIHLLMLFVGALLVWRGLA